MSLLLERFLRYVRMDTQSDETSTAYPSTAKQLALSRLLAEECRALGLADVVLSQWGIVTAIVPATVAHQAPTIAWLAHVDTSPETSGAQVKPMVHASYDGGDLVLSGDPGQVLKASDNPALAGLVGGTIITTDGTTLLGADDKAGVAVIMTAADYLLQHTDVSHGPIRLCFTCDEEIGRGVDKLELEDINAVCAYTLDGGGQGGVDVETFSADQAIVEVIGVNTHPMAGKGVMINALRILSRFIDRLPTDRLSPETTEGRQGFMHPYVIEGGVGRATARILLRDFETEKLKEYGAQLNKLAEDLQREFPGACITVQIQAQYRNMRDALRAEPRAVAKALEATQAAGMEPRQGIIRGGTDGSRLSERGLPTPNLSTGYHNAHSPLEWTSVEEMENAVEVLVALAAAWGVEQA